ncbi:hypothetical protein [Halogranum rubrum]|nr:hypothetical protein [Halogranum rubrum]
MNILGFLHCLWICFSVRTVTRIIYLPFAHLDMGHHPARSRLALVVALVLLCSTLSFGVAAQSQYSLTVDGGIDTPDKTVTVEGQSFDVSETVRVEPGDEIAVETSGPTDKQYRVNLLNKKNQIAAYNNTLSGEESFSFETEGLTPGSYVVAVYGADGNYKMIQPVVVSGYDVSTDVDNTVEEDSESTITVDVEPKQNAPELESVKVMVSNDDDDIRTLTASETDDGTYTATTTFETSGEFDVFATVRGTDTFNGEKEILGISDVQSITVDDDSSDSSGSDDSSGDSNTETPTMTTTATMTATQPAETTEPSDASPTDSPETTESAQTPAPTTTNTTSPLHAVQLLLFVLVVVGSVYQLRNQ